MGKIRRAIPKVLSAMVMTFAIALSTWSHAETPMQNYCVTPPYVKTDVPPNVLIMMDNAYNMGDAAYCIPDADYATNHLCTDNYDPTKTYGGYFNSALKYKYNSKFIPDANGIFSGNLLNWATTSRYDLLENILVGGLSTSRQTNVNTLISKSNLWTKTLVYNDGPDGTGATRTCIFNVNNANLEVTESVLDECGYLDNPAKPIPVDPIVSFIETKTRLAQSVFHGDQDLPASGLQGAKGPEKRGFLSAILTAIADFLVPSAEAASSQLRIAAGPAALPDTTECTAYKVTISASGGSDTGPYTWRISSGALPAGLTLGPLISTPSTTIYGTPTAGSGTYNFTIEVKDSAGTTDTKDYSIKIDDATVTITTSATLQEGYVGARYYVALNASGECKSKYTWTLTAGSLPPSFSIFTESLTVKRIYYPGDPTTTTAGDYSFTLKVTDSQANTASRNFTLRINDAPTGITITTGSPLNSGTVGATSFILIESMNGVGPFTWSVVPAVPDPLTKTGLPAGMSFGYGTAITTNISGKPALNSEGTYSFTVKVVDNGSNETSKIFSITINPAPKNLRTTGNMNVSICIGDYAVNCNTGGHAGGSGSLKSGLVDQFWSQARFGLMTFNKQAGVALPNIDFYISTPTTTVPDSNYLTNVENAVSIDPPTTLVDGEYEALKYYKTPPVSKDPFVGCVKCTKSFVLIITAGVGANLGTSVFPTLPSVCTAATLTNLAKNACYGANTDFVSTFTGTQIVSTYIVNTLGTAATSTYDPDDAPITNGDVLMQAAVKGGGIYYEVQDPNLLKAQLQQALQDIIKRAGSGTAASVLASGEGSGANLVQAVFYPRRKFGLDEIGWIGRLTNLWYYVDPNLNNSSIREDAGALVSGTTYTTGDKVLTLKTSPTGTQNDHIVQLFFDTDNEITKAHRWNDENGDSIIDTDNVLPDIDFESIGKLWEAGNVLWNRTTSRKIYTSTGSGLIDFSTDNKTDLRPYLQAETDSEAEALIRWVHGEDTPLSGAGLSGFSYRPRSVSIDGSARKTWKLGDVLNSTPKISSWLPLNGYHRIYNDTTYGVPGKDPSLQDTADNTHYITSDTPYGGYRGRNMIFAGANDGMLHAFRLGTLEYKWTGQGDFDKARLKPGPGLGEEVWAFIPKNALPYLRYTANPAYCHVYSVDLTPVLFDASIGAPGSGDESNIVRTKSHWRTILIGGMRYGGACKPYNTTCAINSVCTPTVVDSENIGYSSYFALDITDQENPTLLWEFSDPQLGFSTSGPAVVRISVKDGATPNNLKNGKWFVVLGSGPTGPIEGSQFMGRSDQQLRLFVLDLKTGALKTTFDKDANGNALPANAFAGSMINATMDTSNPLNYQDDLVYIPFVNDSGDSTWTSGGVLRLSTGENTNSDQWKVSKLIDNIGPVTAAVSKLQNNTYNNLWAFFGTGRYFFEKTGTADDPNGKRHLFGIKDPCFKPSGYDAACTDSWTFTDSRMKDVTTDLTKAEKADLITDKTDLTNYVAGWYINLDESGVPDFTTRAERVITDPVAASTGVVFFTTFKPYSDECALGGLSYIWAMKYNTGGDASALLKGQALIQVSTGSIEQLKLSDAFKDKAGGPQTGNRKTLSMVGVPPTAQGLSIITTPPAAKKVLHRQQRER